MKGQETKPGHERTAEPGEQAGTGRRRAATPPAARAHARQVEEWAIANGRPLSPAALSVLLAVKLARPEGDHRWTAETVSELLWTGIVGWCQGNEIDCPERMAETLWTYLTYLGEARLLGPGSDPLAELRAPLVAFGGLTRDGRERVTRRRHPSEQVRTARPSARLAPVVRLRPASGD